MSHETDNGGAPVVGWVTFGAAAPAVGKASAALIPAEADGRDWPSGWPESWAMRDVGELRLWFSRDGQWRVTLRRRWPAAVELASGRVEGSTGLHLSGEAERAAERWVRGYAAGLLREVGPDLDRQYARFIVVDDGIGEMVEGGADHEDAVRAALLGVYVDDGDTATGTVRFPGKPPRRYSVRVDASRCECIDDDPLVVDIGPPAPSEQPAPTLSPESRPVMPEVLAETGWLCHRGREPLEALLVEREAKGLADYKVRLHTHNGRDALHDCAEELADALMYGTQAAMEQGGPEPRWLSDVRGAALGLCLALEQREGG